MSKSIRRVAIVGGTHGNELTGVYLVQKFQQFPELLHRDSLDCVTLLANPRAIAANRRYIDRDLNRSFASADLLNPALTGYEDELAKQIAAQLQDVDLIIDLHSSTAKMGLTILPSSSHPFNMRLAAYLSTLHPDVRVCCGANFDAKENQDPMLRSISPLGCTIEVGAIAQGVLQADLLQKTEMLVQAILNYLEALNQNQPLPIPSNLDIYQVISSIDYPRNSQGEIQAIIHPQLQFRDYEALKPGDPLFLTFTDEAIFYLGTSTVFPIFINEAAYYEKGIAMIVTEKQYFNTDDEN